LDLSLGTGQAILRSSTIIRQVESQAKGRARDRRRAESTAWGHGAVGANQPASPSVEWLRTLPEKDLLTEQGFIGIGKLGTTTDVVSDTKGKAPVFEHREPYGSNVNGQQLVRSL
jgi:hypothetical protein